MALTFNDAAGRFVNERGQFVAESAVRSVVDAVADLASTRMAQASTRLLNGEMSLGAWQASLMHDTKLSMLAGGTIARGGEAQMTQSDYGTIGRQLRDQYVYARSFADQITDGTQPLNRTLVSRAQMYGQQARIAYETMRARDQARRGYQSCRNVLHASESCALCRSESARGWVPTGSLIPIGQRTCLSRCRCTIAYRRERAEVAV